MLLETVLILLLILVCLNPRCMVPGKGSLEEKALRIHRDAIVIDTHSDTTRWMLDPTWNFMERHETGHVDYPRIREGGLDSVFLAVYMGEQRKEEPGIAVKKAMEQFDCILSLPERHPDRIELARTVADIRRIAALEKVALLIGVEGGHIIENDLEVLRCYYRLGARYMTLTHVFHHDWADSAGLWEKLPSGQGGLTAFGRDVIREMNRIGMMVDISHVSDETFQDTLEVSKAPVVATHSGARALCDCQRNLTDDMIKALAAGGGVMQVVFFAGFLDPDYQKKKEEAQEQQRKGESEVRERFKDDPTAMRAAERKIKNEVSVEGTPLQVLVDHIEHVIDLVGPDHVGLGADWDGIATTVDGLEDCSKLPALTLELLRRGHGEAVIKKVLGENLLRVMEEVERVAARLNDAPAGPARPG